MIRFYGTPETIRRWSEVVFDVTGVTCGPEIVMDGRTTVTADLTTADRDKLMEVWYDVDTDPSNEFNFRWNLRISFLEIVESPPQIAARMTITATKFEQRVRGEFETDGETLAKVFCGGDTGIAHQFYLNDRMVASWFNGTGFYF